MTDHSGHRYVFVFFALAHCLLWTLICLNIILMVWQLSTTKPDATAKPRHLLKLIVESKSRNLGNVSEDQFFEN